MSAESAALLPRFIPVKRIGKFYFEQEGTEGKELGGF
jgi:hypothetical protein